MHQLTLSLNPWLHSLIFPRVKYNTSYNSYPRIFCIPTANNNANKTIWKVSDHTVYLFFEGINLMKSYMSSILLIFTEKVSQHAIEVIEIADNLLRYYHTKEVPQNFCVISLRQVAPTLMLLATFFIRNYPRHSLNNQNYNCSGRTTLKITPKTANNL